MAGRDVQTGLLASLGMRQVLILGLDGSGKSSFLWMCEHPGEPSLPVGCAGRPGAPPSESTVGVLRLMQKGVPHPDGGFVVDLDLTEVGGDGRVRPYWSRYLSRETAALVFLLDASQPSRLDEAAAELSAVLASARAGAAPSMRVLLVASKVDDPGARPSAEVFARVAAVAKVDLAGIATAELALLGAKDGAGRKSVEALLSSIARSAAD